MVLWRRASSIRIALFLGYIICYGVGLTFMVLTVRRLQRRDYIFSSKVSNLNLNYRRFLFQPGLGRMYSSRGVIAFYRILDTQCKKSNPCLMTNRYFRLIDVFGYICLLVNSHQSVESSCWAGVFGSQECLLWCYFVFCRKQSFFFVACILNIISTDYCLWVFLEIND